MERRVLVVEDDPAMREGFALILELEGYQVRRAANGREALETLASWRADAILLDLMMPVMNGWEFRSSQLQDQAIAAIPIIVVSGCAESDREVAALNPAGFLQKPARPAALVEKMRSLLA